MFVGAAFTLSRRRVINLLTGNPVDPNEDRIFANAALEQLRAFLVEGVVEPFGLTMAPMGIRDAYLFACKMLAIRRRKLLAGKDTIPLISLAHINALAHQADPVQAVKEARELVKEARRTARRRKPKQSSIKERGRPRQKLTPVEKEIIRLRDEQRAAGHKANYYDIAREVGVSRDEVERVLDSFDTQRRRDGAKS
jgi:hypothetical protein